MLIFFVDSVENDIMPWLKNADVSSKGYMLGYNNLKVPSVSGFFRFLSKVGDGMMKMKIVKTDFLSDK